MVYSLQVREQPSLVGSVNVRFVFCKRDVPGRCGPGGAGDPTLRRHHRARLRREHGQRQDVHLLLHCGARVRRHGRRSPPRRYDYVMKADDDMYLRLPTLVGSLRGKAREDAYYGLVMPCDRKNFYPFPPFMSGMGYALSWDLVQWVAASEVARSDRDGLEDMWTGRWLNLVGKAKNCYDNAPRMYNYRGDSLANCFRHDFILDTIAVHMLKDAAQWAEALKYFNATAALLPSDLYHLP